MMGPAMLTLVLETSTPHGSVALFEGPTLLESRAFQARRGHNSKIFRPLGDLLESLGDRSLARLVVGTGPGSYTGVRIAIAIADALALSHGAELTGYCSLTAGQKAGGQDRYWMVGDARRKSWFRAEVCRGQLAGPIVTEPRASWEEEVRRALGQGMAVHTFGEEAPLSGVRLDVPSAERLGVVAQNVGPGPGPVEPCYLAAPYITKAKRPGKVLG